MRFTKTFLFICLFACSVFAQSAAPITVFETSSGKRLVQPRSFVVPNGSIIGRTVTFAGGGSGAAVGSPVTGATAQQVFYGGTGGNLAQSPNFIFNPSNQVLITGGYFSNSKRVGEYIVGDGLNYLGDPSVPLSLSSNSTIYFRSAGDAIVAGTSPNGLFLGSSIDNGLARLAPAMLRVTDGGGGGGIIIQSQATVTTSGAISAATTIVNSASATTQTLPTAVGKQGVRYLLKNVGAGTLTVNTTSAQTIFTTSAVTSQNLATGESYTFESTGSAWISY